MQEPTRYCPFNNGECVKNCELKFGYPERSEAMCALKVITIILFDIHDKLSKIIDAKGIE